MDRLTIKDVAKVMGIPEQSVRLLIQQNQLPFMMLQGGKRNTYYIFKNKLLEFLGIDNDEFEKRLRA